MSRFIPVRAHTQNGRYVSSYVRIERGGSRAFGAQTKTATFYGGGNRYRSGDLGRTHAMTPSSGRRLATILRTTRTMGRALVRR